MSELALVGLLAAGTYVMRASLVSLLAGVAIPTPVEQALRLIAPAVLGGLVAQTLFLAGGDVRSLGSWHVAAIGAGLVAWRTRSIGLTLVAGMLAVWGLEAIG